VCFEEQRCLVKISDDGSGFSYATLPPSSSAGHYGLLGMRERVERIGGKFILNSRIDAGTHLIIEVPRTVAAARKNEMPEVTL
jgi:signal transduction histidine kinase